MAELNKIAPPPLNLGDYLDNPRALRTRGGKLVENITRYASLSNPTKYVVRFSNGDISHYDPDGTLWAAGVYPGSDILLRENVELGKVKDAIGEEMDLLQKFPSRVIPFEELEKMRVVDQKYKEIFESDKIGNAIAEEKPENARFLSGDILSEDAPNIFQDLRLSVEGLGKVWEFAELQKQVELKRGEIQKKLEFLQKRDEARNHSTGVVLRDIAVDDKGNETPSTEILEEARSQPKPDHWLTPKTPKHSTENETQPTPEKEPLDIGKVPVSELYCVTGSVVEYVHPLNPTEQQKEESGGMEYLVIKRVGLNDVYTELYPRDGNLSISPIILLDTVAEEEAVKIIDRIKENTNNPPLRDRILQKLKEIL